MIVAAALLVLLGLGLFVGGVLTDLPLLYWACVAACVAAGVFLVLARVRMGRAPSPSAPSPSTPSPAAPSPSTPELPAATGSTAAEPVAGSSPEPVAASVDEAQPAAARAHRGVPGPVDMAGDPPVEEVEVTDLLLVFDLRDEVLVVDEHPRYHLGGCRWLSGRDTIPLPVDEARADGFTPCARCRPDRTLAERERARRGRPA